MSDLKIGWAEVSIVPEKKAKLAGQFFERISEYVETPITVTAMAIESNDNQFIICSCDLVSVSINLFEAVKTKVAEQNREIDINSIVVAATHTHASILYDYEDTDAATSLDILKRYLPEDKEYIEKVEDDDILEPKEALVFLADRISACIVEAWENRKKAYFSNQFGRAAVGHCRRVVYDDGTAKMWGDTNTANFESLEAASDSGIELIYTFDESKRLTGIVANIACPSQVVEHRSYISSDYWGKVRILLREKFGEELKVLGLCSPAGDQCPRDMIRWVNPETPIDDPNIKRDNYIVRKADPSMFDIEGTWKIGKRIANEIIDVYDNAVQELQDKAELKHEKLILDLPVRRVSITEYNNAKKELEAYIKEKQGKFDFNDKAKLYIFAGTMARYEYQQTNDIHQIEVHIAKLGDVAFATNPFELFLDYGNQIRARSKASQTFLIQLANGDDGYLPTKRAEQGSHYSAYVSSGITGHQGGEILVRKTVQKINEMWG